MRTDTVTGMSPRRAVRCSAPLLAAGFGIAGLAIAGGCTSEGESASSPQEIVEAARSDLVPESVEPAVDPPAFLPTWLPDGFEIDDVSAASPDFMSISIAASAADNPATASVIWGNEMSDFETLADRDPESSDVMIGQSSGTLFSFDSGEDSVGPALFWREPPDVPVLVIGSPEFTSDQIRAIAEGVERTTQQEFVDLAVQLAEVELFGE